MSVQPRIIQSDGHAVLTGVQMAVKAALEFGVEALVGAQLDTPATYTQALHDHAALFADKGIATDVLPDARQAIAALHSAWINGRQTLGVFDATGVTDAAGVLLAGEPERAAPGAVALCFGPSDTIAGAAATALLRRAGWVVIEPALQDEVKAFVRSGLTISASSGRPVAVALAQSHYGGAATVACQPNAYPGTAEDRASPARPSESMTPAAAVRAEARAQQVNAVVNPPGRDEALPLALIAVGRAFGWARQAMAELGLAGRVPILRLGVLAPIDRELVRRHIGRCRRVLVLDASGINVAEAVCASRPESEPSDELPPPEVLPITLGPDAGPGGVIRALGPWLESHPTLPRELVSAGLARAGAHPTGSAASGPPARGQTPPPGSSLVDLSVVIGRLRRDLSDTQYMLEQHRAAPIDLSIFGELDDAARRLLTRWSPLAGGLACDGRLAGAASVGAPARDDRRALVMMTSRRFFSLGVSAIADAVRARRNTVFVIHTEDPAEALGPRRRWQRRPKVSTLDIQAIVQSIGTGQPEPRPGVTTIDPSDRPRTRRLLERLVLSPGVQVVIARRRRGPRYYRKASEVHRKQSARRGYVARQGCLVHCTEAGPLSPRRRLELGVLGVEPTEPGDDPWTVSVSWSWADETVMHALGEPAVGIAVLERTQPERSRVVAEDLDALPEPAKPLHARSDAWRATLAGITGSAFDLTLELLLEAGAAMGYLVRSTQAPDPPDEPTPRTAHLLFTRQLPANAPHVPAAPGRSSAPMLTAQPLPGHADLFLGAELTEAARHLGSAGPTAAPPPTPALIDTLIVPDIASLDSGARPDPAALLRSVVGDPADPPQPAGAQAAALPIAQLAEWCWGHQRYAAWVYLGYLVQRGLVPLTTTAIDAAGQRVLGVSDPRGAEAVKVGRKLAVDPGYARRALEQDPPEPGALLRTVADDLAEQAGSRRGASLAGTFQALTQPLLDEAGALGDDACRQLITTAQRCVLWGGPKHGPGYCERFVNAMRHVLSIDDADHDWQLASDAARGLANAMLIPDEVYLAALLTAPARYRRDRRRLNVSLERGDKISYIHTLRPEFDLFKRRVGFTVTLGDRALKTLATQHWLRRIRPGWYRTQRAFRDLYLDALLNLPRPTADTEHDHARAIAQCAHDLRGRGETRRASVESARRKLEKLLSGGEAG